MAVIRIQTVLSNDKVFRFEIESDDLYTIHCLTQTPIQTVEHQIAQDEYGAQLLKGCGLLLHCTAGGYRYLIDATHKTVLTIRNGKW